MKKITTGQSSGTAILTPSLQGSVNIVEELIAAVISVQDLHKTGSIKISSWMHGWRRGPEGQKVLPLLEALLAVSVYRGKEYYVSSVVWH